MIPYIARLYVNIIEPALMLIGLIIGLAFVLYLFTMLRGGDAKNSLPGQVVNITFKGILKTLQYSGKAVIKFLSMLLKTTVLIFATMRDFFKSKI